MFRAIVFSAAATALIPGGAPQEQPARFLDAITEAVIQDLSVSHPSTLAHTSAFYIDLPGFAEKAQAFGLREDQLTNRPGYAAGRPFEVRTRAEVESCEEREGHRRCWVTDDALHLELGQVLSSSGNETELVVRILTNDYHRAPPKVMWVRWYQISLSRSKRGWVVRDAKVIRTS